MCSKTEQQENPTAVVQAMEALDKTMRNMAEKKYLMNTRSKTSSDLESGDSSPEVFADESSYALAGVIESKETGFTLTKDSSASQVCLLH